MQFKNVEKIRLLERAHNLTLTSGKTKENLQNTVSGIKNSVEVLPLFN